MKTRYFAFLIIVLLMALPAVACTTTDTTSTAATEAVPADVYVITDIVWQWETFNDVAADTSTRVDDATKYTIVFNTDGTTTGRADCNTFSGTYSQQNGFSITVSPDIMAACDQGSMDQQFLRLLEEVAAGGPDGVGGLRLQTPAGAQELLFSNGGPVPKD